MIAGYATRRARKARPQFFYLGRVLAILVLAGMIVLAIWPGFTGDAIKYWPSGTDD
jgi:hypothetical protein